MKFHFQLLIALAIAKVYSKQCGEGIGKCKNNYCCSKYGWCGTDDSYCGAGCQQEFGKCSSTSTTTPENRSENHSENHSVSIDGRCGPNNNNTTCPKNQCCSKYGWCGTSSDYCDRGCQSEFGRCNSVTSTTSTTSSATSSTPTNNSKPISTDDHCGPNYNNTYCPNNKCCSKYGWCGTSSDHCDGGCQSEFGRCNGVTSTTSTTSSATSSTPTNNSKPISTDDHCGPNYNNTYCPNNKCCSEYGWCGTSEDHCGKHCQSEFGRCNNNDAYTNTSYPISTDGRCGAEFGTRCPYGECCSQYGWCSSKDTHCNEGCQHGYGDCAEDINKRVKVYSKCINKKHWALTFDDGPYLYDEALLDYLKSVNVKATFFVIGHDYLSDNNSDNKRFGKKIIKRMYEEGYEIENHTFNHLNLNDYSSEKIIEEITQLENTIKNIINVKPAFIRPLYGEYN